MSIQKNIVTLHMKLEADETERKYDMRPKRDLTTDPRYKAMRTILERSNIN